MSLTTKLTLGFVFALVLQVLQMGISSHFTSRMQDASEQVSAALSASIAVQGALEAVDAMRQLARNSPQHLDGNSLNVLDVYAEEISRQIHGVAVCCSATSGNALASLQGELATLIEQLFAVRRATMVGDDQATADELAFLDDAAQQLEEALRQTQVRVRSTAEHGVEQERAVHDLPMRASLAITIGGVLLMGAFVAWFSRQLVAPIERAWSELEARVQERTQELAQANEGLRQAKDAADRASRSKTTFLANVSHELRSPMTAILGYTEELQQRCTEHGGDRFEMQALETISRNTQHLVAVINDLLDIAKIEAGKLSVEIRPCRPRQVMADIAELLRPKAQGNGVTIELSSSDEVPDQVTTDPVRLRQIVTNLLDNAIKFSPGGLVKVQLDRAPAECLVVQVSDTGCGMSDDLMQRLFQPFEQECPTVNRRHGGTGLGLALSREFARLLGGDLVATTTPGSGSTFTLTVSAPVVEAAASPDQRHPAHPSPGQPAALAAAKGLRVLLVEDGRDNQLLIRRILERTGMHVEVADNGAVCLERLAGTGQQDFDLVLMDVQMPVMDGMTATRKLRERHCELPIVALTASAMVADQEACSAAGCTAFLAKPIDRPRLLATITALATTHRLRG